MSEEPEGMFGKDGALETVAASLMGAAYGGVEAWAKLRGSRRYRVFALRAISRGLPPFASSHPKI